jgi:hypothetical protein
VDTLVAAGDAQGLKALAYHLVPTAWKQLDINFGDNPRGANGATPSEPLHQVDLGTFKYGIKAFFMAIGAENCKLHSVIDEWARRVGKYLLHQSDRDLPRTYFPNGISGGTKLAAHEQIGVFLVLHILLSMEAPRQLILNYKNNDMTRTKLNRWRTAFGLQLAWRAWIKRPSIPLEEVKLATDGHQRLMKYLNRYARRTESMQWCIIKFHMILHMAQNIIDFGVPSNIDTSPMEHNHIENAKNPSKGTQLRAYSIERQTAQRYYENLVVQHAYDVIGIPRDGVAVPQTNVQQDSNMLRGSRFKMEFWEGGEGESTHFNFAWYTKKSKG